MISDLSRFPERLVDHWVEGNNALYECAPRRSRDGWFGPGRCERAGKAGRDSCRQVCKTRGQQPPGAAEIGCSENDAGADDANASLARTGDSQHEYVTVCAAGCTELITGNHR